MPSSEIEVSIHEAVQRIKNLMTQEKWLEAHRACLEVLRFDPENLQVIRLKNKIEKIVKKINIQAIKEDLKNIRPLWKERKFEELLEHLKELQPYQNEYQPLKDFIQKVQRAYMEKVVQDRKKYYAEEMARLKELAKEKKYQEAMRAAQRLRIMKIRESEIKKLIQRIKEEWIDQELQNNQALFESDKYEDALLKVQQIKKIDPSSEKIKKLMNSLKKKYQSYRVMEKRDFIAKGFEKMRTLMQLKKFEGAARAAAEILEIDPDNKKARSLFARAKRKADKSTERALHDQMKKAHGNMKEHYRQDKSRYIKI